MVPVNYILLGFLSILIAVTISGYAAQFRTESILMSIGTPAMVVATLFIYTVLVVPRGTNYLRWYMTMGLIVTVVLNVLLLSVLMWCDVLQNWLMVIYCSLGVVLSSSYVFIDLMFI